KSHRLHLCGCDFAHAEKLFDGKAFHKRLDFRWADKGKAVRLLHIGGDLGYKFIDGDASRRGELQLFADLLLNAPGDLYGRPNILFVARHIQVSLIQGKRFDGVCVAAENCPDFVGNGLVNFESWKYEYRFGTQPLCDFRRHSRPDAKPARLVAGGCYDTTPAFRRPAYNQWLTPVSWKITLFYRRIKLVHVNVDDFASWFHVVQLHQQRINTMTVYQLAFCRPGEHGKRAVLGSNHRQRVPLIIDKLGRRQVPRTAYLRRVQQLYRATRHRLRNHQLRNRQGVGD